MRASTDPGSVIGKCWAHAPGPRMSQREATRLGAERLDGARVNRVEWRITVACRDVDVVVLAGASMPAKNFLAAGV